MPGALAVHRCRHTEPGANIDVVLQDAYNLPFGSDSVDVFVSTSCFEHSEMFWVVYLEIMRVLKPSGLFYLNVPSNGPYHWFPVDCWRFYPDSGAALVAWGKNAFLEAYIGNPKADVWNDYVCVFIKDEDYAHAYTERILESFNDFTVGYLRTREGELQEWRPA